MSGSYLGAVANGALFGVHIGQRIVARAWTDQKFAEWLRHDSTQAIQSLGYHVRTVHSDATESLVTVENTPQVHNLVVCTLCSCYPKSILGLPPNWYKSESYRDRAVREPRALLKEFGLVIPESVDIRVWDSTALKRYIVIPMRPEGTNHLSVEELESIVPRDSLIGTAIVNYK
jgi:nitrile hydratase subunit alpha